MTTMTRPTASTPIVILTGFLGAGKTTLLKRCLLNTAGLRIALVRNEFTAAEEDLTFECPLLLKDDDEQEFASFWELPNTCVCCTLKSQFLQGVSKMVTKAHSYGKPFDLVMVEISGVADPIDVASGIISEGDPDEEVIRLGGIISVIDMARIDEHLNLENAASLLQSMLKNTDKEVKGHAGLKYLLLKQICSSNLIILNKRDLVEEHKAEELKQRLSALTLGATIITTDHCSFDITLLRQLVNSNNSEANMSIASKLPVVHTHMVDLSEGVSIPGLMKYVWRSVPGRSVNISLFEESLLRLVWTLGDQFPDAQVFRAKGILIANKNDTYEVHLVGDSVQITRVSLTALPNESCCLFVGISLPTSQIDEALDASCTTPQLM